MKEELLGRLKADTGVGPCDEEDLQAWGQLEVAGRSSLGRQLTLPARLGTSRSGENLFAGGKMVAERSLSGQ